MRKMSKFDKNCLFCLKDVNLEVDDKDGGVGVGGNSFGRATRSTSKEKGREIQPLLTLFQLVQHGKFVRSMIEHQNIIQQHEGVGTCALCDKCAALKEDIVAVGGQIIALQAILKGMVGVMRGRIEESDGEIRSRSRLSQEDLDRLLAIRQSLLILSDGDSDDYTKVDVNIKIEEGAAFDDNFDENLLVDVIQPHADADEEFVKEEGDDRGSDSDCPFFISPHTARNNNIRWVSTITDDNDSSDTSQGNQGYYQETQVVMKQIPNNRRVRRASRKISYEASSSSDTDQELERDPLAMEEEEVEIDGNEEKKDLDKYYCYYCKDGFTTAEERIAHIKSEHTGCDVPPFQCLVCQETFSKPSRLQTHMMVRHKDIVKLKPPSMEAFPCSKCNKKFKRVWNLQRHLEHHKCEEEKPVLCEACGARFEDTARLEVHALIHGIKLKCKLCNNSYSTKCLLDRHERTHTGEKPFQCDHCQERFIDNPTRQNHMNKIHSEPRHLCTICGETFYSLLGLKTHLDRHEGTIKKWPCGTCEEVFEASQALTRHNILKHGHNLFVCDQCGKQLTTKAGFKRHKMAHAGDKPHKCDTCDARFLTKQCLQGHMSMHSTERPFVCHHCGKGFKRTKDLSTHVKLIHTANYVVPTPCLCSHCGKSYAHKGLLNAHVRQAHTGERPFVCKECNKGFAIKGALIQHMKSHGINISREKGPRLPRSKRDSFSNTEDEGCSSSVGLQRINTTDSSNLNELSNVCLVSPSKANSAINTTTGENFALENVSLQPPSSQFYNL